MLFYKRQDCPLYPQGMVDYVDKFMHIIHRLDTNHQFGTDRDRIFRLSKETRRRYSTVCSVTPDRKDKVFLNEVNIENRGKTSHLFVKNYG